MKRARRLLSVLSALSILCLAAAPSWTQESVVAMCEKTAQVFPEQGSGCECALTAVKDQISSDEFMLYANVGTRYLENVANGLARSDAWDAAAKTIGDERGMSLVDVLTITNPIGRLHAKAIKDCA